MTEPIRAMILATDGTRLWNIKSLTRPSPETQNTISVMMGSRNAVTITEVDFFEI